MKRHDFLLNPPSCAACREPMRTLFEVYNTEDTDPEPGMVVICHHCVHINILDENLHLVTLTEHHRRAMRVQAPGLSERLDAAVAMLKQRKRDRGELP